MQDETWRDLDGPWARLRWARQKWQRDAGAIGGSAEDAARSLGMKAGTYRAYEREPGSSKHIDLDHQAAIRFGRKFKISWKWLLLGEGSPFDEDELPRTQERVIRVMTGMPEEDQEALAAMVESFAKSRVAARR